MFVVSIKQLQHKFEAINSIQTRSRPPRVFGGVFVSVTSRATDRTYAFEWCRELVSHSCKWASLPSAYDGRNAFLSILASPVPNPWTTDDVQPTFWLYLKMRCGTLPPYLLMPEENNIIIVVADVTS